MIKLIGSILLMGGASLIGFSAAAHLQARVRCLSAFAGAVAQMKRELSFRLSPTPRLFGELARSAQPPARGFFALCAAGLEQLGDRTLPEIWRESLDKSGLPLEEDELQSLLELGETVGRYDGQGQLEALTLTGDRLERYLQRAAEEQARLSKVYRALGVSAGAFLLLVFL